MVVAISPAGGAPVAGCIRGCESVQTAIEPETGTATSRVASARVILAMLVSGLANS